MTKLHGLETLFYSTPVVVLVHVGNQFVLDSQQSVKRLKVILLIILMLNHEL
jgi:hypothetical protein